MQNPFFYADDNKRYHTLAYFYKQHGGKMYKAVVDAGFTCPNIDGRCGTGGCIYCDGGSGYFTKPGQPITQQITNEVCRIRKKHPKAAIIAYFQAHTNTYAPLETLQQVYTQALSHPDISGLSIATRADCLPQDIIAYLATLSRQTNVTVELGLQTVHDATAARIHRGHDFTTFQKAFLSLKANRIRTCVHIINGLPGETAADMLQTAKILGKLKPDGVKIHLLHVIRGTPLATLYQKGDYTPMQKQAYIDVVVNQLEYLPAETVIERITGDGDKQKLLAPLWSADKISVLGSIDKAHVLKNSWQGKKL